MVLSVATTVNAQQERKYIRKGVKEYRENDFGNSEVYFRKALDEDEKSWEAKFNTGNSLYKQDKPADAAEMFNQLLKAETDKDRKADLYYNIGNTHLKNQEYEKSIDAYKNVLRNRSHDDDARYNLAYAMSMLQQQENQENKNDEQKDEDKNDQQGQQDQQENDTGEDDRQQQPKEIESISKEEAERILQAIQDREKEVQEEAEKKRAKTLASPNEKDW